MKLGFIGLGRMGYPMALNLARRGHAELTVHSANSSRYPDFAALGVMTARGPEDFAAADVVFLCLPNGEVVRDVLLGAQGLARQLRAGALVVDTSTIEHAATLEIANSLKEQGIDWLDAPVSGMQARAVDGTLTVMCGGDKAAFDRAEPYLRCLGSEILYMGPTGSGQLTKLVNQLLFDANCAALAEVLPMAVKMGLDAKKVGAVVNSGTGRSHASEFFVPRILKGNFSTGYPMRSAYKDLVSAAELGARACIPMPVLAATTATYQAALLDGHGALDKGAMILPAERRLGVQFRSTD